MFQSPQPSVTVSGTVTGPLWTRRNVKLYSAVPAGRPTAKLPSAVCEPLSITALVAVPNRTCWRRFVALLGLLRLTVTRNMPGAVRENVVTTGGRGLQAVGRALLAEEPLPPPALSAASGPGVGRTLAWSVCARARSAEPETGA